MTAARHILEALNAKDLELIPLDLKRIAQEHSVRVQAVADVQAMLQRTLTDPVKVYRAIALSNRKGLKGLDLGAWIKKVDFRSIGVYWTWDKDVVAAYGFGAPFTDDWDDNTDVEEVLVFAGLVAARDVDWQETVRMNAHPFLGDDEREIRVKPKSPIQIIGVQRYGDARWKSIRIRATT